MQQVIFIKGKQKKSPNCHPFICKFRLKKGELVTILHMAPDKSLPKWLIIIWTTQAKWPCLMGEMIAFGTSRNYQPHLKVFLYLWENIRSKGMTCMHGSTWTKSIIRTNIQCLGTIPFKLKKGRNSGIHVFETLVSAININITRNHELFYPNLFATSCWTSNSFSSLPYLSQA